MSDAEEIKALLLRFDARHADGCPQRQQNYWRMRPEYRPGAFVGTPYGPDRPCTCGLDALLGQHDDRRQS